MRATQICCDSVPPDLKRVADMINQGAGTRVPGAEPRKRNASRRNAGDKYARLMPDTLGLRGCNRNDIIANLLTKLRLTGNRVRRDLSFLEYGVGEICPLPGPG